jgi:peptidoglycan LD-endopeptidase LytH
MEEPRLDRRTFLRSLAVAGLGAVVPALPAMGDESIPLYFPQDPEVTRFSSSFGYVKPDGRVHKGNDLHAPKHSPVYAAADGVVTRLGVGVLAGYYAVIAHGGGWETFYVHLNNDRRRGDDRRGHELAYAEGIERGVFVAAGQQIGFVGNSGNAEGTSPHTHFELHRDGRAIDPYPALVSAFRRVREARSLGDVPLVPFD